MKRISTTHWISEFDSQGTCKEQVELGEIFQVETLDCYGGKIRTSEDLRSQVKVDYLNPAVGPIEIKGLLAGKIGKIEVMDIEVDSQGVMAIKPGYGPLGDFVVSEDTRILPIQNGKIHFTEKLVFPVAPMIGVIGFFPKEGSFETPLPGSHGGNLDTKEICKGSEIYLPVHQDGGGLALGDLHALMGDGELYGAGVEVAGRVTLRVTEAELAFDLREPLVIKGEDAYLVITGTDFPDALDKGLKELVRILEITQGLSFNDAYRLTSLIADIRISQVVNELITIKFKVPKKYFSM